MERWDDGIMEWRTQEQDQLPNHPTAKPPNGSAVRDWRGVKRQPLAPGERATTHADKAAMARSMWR